MGGKGIRTRLRPARSIRLRQVKPFARIDHAGLLWLLNADKLVMLTADHAVIETVTGARQTYRRRPIKIAVLSRVLARGNGAVMNSRRNGGRRAAEWDDLVR